MADQEEKTSDQVLAELVGLDAPPEPLEPTPGAAEAPTKQSEESAPQAHEADKPSGEVNGTPVSQDPRTQRARDALKRSGFSDSIIDSMDAEDLLATGLKRAEVLAADDDAYRRLRELERALKDSGTETEASEAEQVDVAADLRARLKPLQDALADDGEATGPLVDAIAKLAERLDRYEQGLTATQDSLRQTSEQKEAEMVSASRGRLSERFAELGNDEVFAKVKERMALLAKDGSFRDPSKTVEQRLDSVLEAAARSMGYTDAPPAPPAAEAQSNAGRAKGSPLSPTVPPNNPARQLTPDEREWAIFQGIEKGLSTEEIRAQVG